MIGAVSGVVSVETSDNLKVVCTSRALTLREVTSSRVYACVNTPPLVYSGCERTEIAPYNTFYPALEEHLKATGVNPLLNLWNVPSNLSNSSATSFPVTLLPSDQFTAVCSPVLLPLPSQYGRRRLNP